MRTRILILLLITMLMPMQVSARPSLLEATYEEALRHALFRSPTLTPIERELRQIAVAIREADNMRIFYINDDTAKSDFYVSEYMRLNIEQERLRLERDRYRLDTELNLRRNLAALSGLRMDIRLLRATITLQESLLAQTELRHDLGMASRLELTEAQRTPEESRLNLDMLNLQIQSANQNLSHLINRHLAAAVAVEYEHLDIPPVPDAAMRPQFIEFHTQNNPLYRIRVMEAERARHDWQRQIDDPEVDNLLTRLDFELAELARDEAERQASAAILAAYANWDRLHEERAALDTELEQARQEREIMLNRLEAGFITQVQADFSLIAVRAAENAIAKWYYEIWQARLRVDHPYMR